MKKSSWNTNSIKNNFSSSYYDYGSLNLYDHKLEEKILLNYIKEGSTCLDLAGGTGRFTEILADNGCKVTLVDMEKNHIDAAKKRFDSKVVDCIEMEAIEFINTKKEKYDLIIISGLLLFLEKNSARNLLEEANKLLNIGGVIIIRDFISKKKNIKVKSKVFDNTFLYYRTEKFYSDLGASGFIICRPLHLFPKIENYIFDKLGYFIYSHIQGNSLYKKISWIPAKYENKMFVIGKL